jgi:transcriptional regulator with XRE-family HTH domain
MTGSEMRGHREMLGLKQTELAERLGVHPMTVSRWERGAVAIPKPIEQLVEMLVSSRKQVRSKRKKGK